MATIPATPQPDRRSPVRIRVRVRGTVQGVGFRPFVYGLARRYALAGFVGNDGEGVFLEAEGAARDVDAFAAALRSEAPVLARVESIEIEQAVPCGDAGFAIVASGEAGDRITTVSPDVAMCEACRRELHDPVDRRYRYPFINCTDCGPRFTIVRDLPYDRPNTTMSAFRMCDPCRREYEDPASRRYHAQPIACPDCGPRLSWRNVDGGDACEGEAALSAAIACLAVGGVVAVKGIGGFHLACRAESRDAIRTLRERKRRVEKPFAVMAPDLETVRQFAIVDADDARVLTSRERPIVLLQRAANPRLHLPEEIAPGHDTIGVMLPYSPMHELLVAGQVLVMTSGNLSEEPIAHDNDEALRRLSPLVDGFLLHDRKIYVATDDSVVRHVDGTELPIRRSRGYAPYPVRLPIDVPDVLAVGGELKATACLTRDRYAFLSQHVGDLGNVETMDAMARACAHLEHVFRVKPRRIACDLHPGYLSTQWAERLAAERGLPLTRVQHHHAHLVALMAEHGVVDEPLLAFVFDGTGYGTDGTIWGGEVLLGGPAGFERVAHLATTPLPGGDSAIRRPSRVALAQLRAAGEAWDDAIPAVRDHSPSERTVLARQLERDLNCVPTSSMGRLLDAVASIAGIRHRITYEGQAAIELEARAAHATLGDHDYAFALTQADDGAFVFDGAPVIAAAARDVTAGVPAAVIAARAHDAVSALVATVAERLRDRIPGARVGLTGGVFQNVLLLRGAASRLVAAGFVPLVHHLVPPNDGGIALGQALVAAWEEAHP